MTTDPQQDAECGAFPPGVHRACAELRFAEGLRRRSEEARGEAAVQEASLLAWLEGVRGNVSELRESTMVPAENLRGDPADPALALALGIWRAGWRLQSELPMLNKGAQRSGLRRPAPAVLGTLNRDVLSFMVQAGVVPLNQVAVPEDPALMADVLRVATSQDVPVLTRTANVLRLLLTGSLFSQGNVATAFLFAKWILTTEGVEPTGVALLSHYASQNLNEFSALREHGTASDWEAFTGASVIDGAKAGAVIVRSVQAGKTLDS